MTENDQPQVESAPLSLRKPLIWLAVPFIIAIPYFWLLLYYFPARGARPPRLTAEHLRVHWFFFWIFSYFPFSANCRNARTPGSNQQCGAGRTGSGGAVIS